MRGLERRAQHVEVEQIDETRVEQPLFDPPPHIRTEVFGVQSLQLIGGVVIAENSLVDGLEEQTGRDGVEGRIIFDVLEGDLDDGLVELLGGDAVEQREFELTGDLGDPGDVLVEPRAGALDGEIDLVGVLRLASAAALHHGDCERLCDV